MAENLLRKNWTDLDSQELRLLLNKRLGGTGQFDGREANPNKFYLPLARESCRVVLTLKDKRIVAVEPGLAFDAAEWNGIAEEIENAILVGPSKIGREYSFSGKRVLGSWRGARSGIQIVPAPVEAPRAPMSNPFILEFPFVGAPDDLWVITNHRRIREHRRLTLLLDALLSTRISYENSRSFESVWVHIPPTEGEGGNGESRWLQRFYWAPLGAVFADALSSPSDETLAEIEAEAYYVNVGNDGSPLSVPADLDDSICRYRDLSKANRSKFDRAIFWMDVASRQWTVSVSSSFASLVSAVESLTGRGNTHQVYCEKCKADRSHDVPGATERFRSFFETYASGSPLRKEVYRLRSDILHGSDLMQTDQDVAWGFDPWDFNEGDLHRDLWSITRLALRNWLKKPPGVL